MTAIPDALNPYYPPQPFDNAMCAVNETFQTLPPPNINDESWPVEWEYVTYGPTTVKHIYSKVPNYYPTQKISRPINTLYGHDFSEFHTSGVGNGKRIGYGYKPYPFTNTNNRERRIYADYLLPYMDIRNFTKYPVIRGGPTLDSPLQKHPFPYYKP